MLERLVQDARHAVRQTFRAPGFAIAVVVTLALSIGANAALFSLVNAIVLRTIPVRDPERLIVLQATDTRGQNRPIYHSTYLELAKLPVFDGLALYSGGGIFKIDVSGVLNDGLIEASTPGLLETLGLRPHLGRFFTEDDEPIQGGSVPVVVVSHDFWMRAFSGNPAAIGQTVSIDGRPAVVIGVTPPDYRGFYVDSGLGFSVPMSFLTRQLGSDPKRPIRGLNAIGRLAPGVSLDQARAAVAAAWPAVRESTVPVGLSPTEQKEIPTQSMTVDSLSTGFSSLRRQYREPLFVVATVAALLLAIGCVNLSGLLLARTAARDQQLAIRFALGASRRRIAQQIVVESVLLALLGAIVALPLAWWTTSVASAVLSVGYTTSLTQSLTPDARTLLVTSSVALVTGLLMAVLPAWSAIRHRPHIGLRVDRTVARAYTRWGQALLIGQVAMSLVLLIGAGLFTSSLAKLRNHDIGVRTDGLRWTRLFAVPGGYRNQNDAVYYPELVREISDVPGVTSVALASYFPSFFSLGAAFGIQPIARSAAEMSEAVDGIIESVTPRFFETVGTALVSGRDFTWTDDSLHPPVTIINESLGRALFPAGNAVGQRLRIGSDPTRREVEIVGIAGDAAIGSYTQTHLPVAFRPRMQELQSSRAPSLVYRIGGSTVAPDREIAGVIARLGHEYPRRFASLDDQVDEALLRERLLSSISSFFAALGLALAFVGLYAALAFAVARRTREIGVRMALGSSRAAVIRMVVGESLILTVAGLIIGIPCAIGGGTLIASLLFGLAPSDPMTIVAASALFLAVGALAAVRPALRAATVDPMTSLKSE